MLCMHTRAVPLANHMLMSSSMSQQKPIKPRLTYDRVALVWIAPPTAQTVSIPSAQVVSFPAAWVASPPAARVPLLQLLGLPLLQLLRVPIRLPLLQLLRLPLLQLLRLPPQLLRLPLLQLLRLSPQLLRLPLLNLLRLPLLKLVNLPFCQLLNCFMWRLYPSWTGRVWHPIKFLNPRSSLYNLPGVTIISSLLSSSNILPSISRMLSYCSSVKSSEVSLSTCIDSSWDVSSTWLLVLHSC